MEVDGAKSAAWRRRQRRLRSWLKHELQTVAMALAECLHHSAQRPEKAKAREVEEQDKNNALRRQKALPPGMHPGVLKPEVQGSLVAPLRPGSGAARGLALPSLTGASGEAVDASSLATLKKSKEADEGKKLEDVRVTEKLIAEAKERRMRRIQVKVRDNLPLSSAEREEWRRWAGIDRRSSSTSTVQRRKKKKKRKKRRCRTVAATWFVCVCLNSAVMWILLGDTSRAISASCATPGSTVATCSCHYSAAWGFSRSFSVKVVLGPWGPFALGMRTLHPRLLVSGTHLFDVVLEYRIMDFSGRRLAEMFPSSALVGPTVDTDLRQSTVLSLFQRNAWFDSGYTFASVCGALSYFSAMLGSTVFTSLRQSTVLFRISAQCLVRQWTAVACFLLVLLGCSSRCVPSVCRQARRQVCRPCPLLCSTDAGIVVQKTVDPRSCSSSIRSSRLCFATATGTHSATVQSSAAMVCLLDSWGAVLGALHTGAGPRGSCPQGHDPLN